MVSITDEAGIIIYVNDKFCEISGYMCDELIGKDHILINPDFHSREFMKGLWSSIAAGTVYQNDIKNTAKDGSYFWTATAVFPFFDESGKPYKYLTISYNITQKKIQEQQLIEVKVLAEKLSKSKDIFLTNVSHEIRTPLNAITGLGKLLSKTDLNLQQKQYLNGIESASENLLSIVNDLLDFSKIEAGKITLENIGFNLEIIAKQAINILTHKAEEKGLDINCSVDERIAPVLIGDPFRINQVFMNMLGNAIKFTEKGHVNLKATLVETVNNSQKILVEIEDTGVGINEEYLRGIFDKFTQEDATVVRKFGGTGLGMSITKELMELMGGSISVKSEKNSGTTIYLEFNFKIGTARVLEKKRTITNNTSNIGGKRILLVEDNNLNRLLANTILTGYGAEIVEAVNGLEAVELMRKENFDIILMDVQMPVMDGIQATQIIRNEITKTVPIIALTANAIKGKLDQFIDIGMDDFIFKPYDELKLVNPISKWLSKSASDIVPPVYEPVKNNIAEAKEVRPVVENGEELKTAEQGIHTVEVLYDLSKLLGMVRDNDDFLIRMLNLFISEIPVSSKKIMQSYEANDFNSVKYYAHLIRPSINNLGINAIKDEILKIELMAQKNERTDELAGMIEKVDKVITMVVDQLKTEYKI
jgi:two-component system, sensor histidine kinase